MKKALSYLLVLCLIYNVFMININVFSYDFVDPNNETSVKTIKKEIKEMTDEYDKLYGSASSVGVFSGTLCPNGITVDFYKTVNGTKTLDHSETMDLETYVAGVVTAENNWSDGGNIENMKAQAVAARTYGVIHSNHCKSSIESSQAKQVYAKPAENSLAVRAAYETSGMILQYNGELFNPEYDAFCVISKTNDSFTINQPSQYHPGQHQVIPASFINQKSASHKNIDYCFGHGRGMSQVGSRYLSTQGYTFDKILEYYYPTGIQIVRPSSSTNWKQCDPAWGSVAIGGSNLCAVGCYVTSIAILISQSGVSTTMGDNFNPGTLAEYLNSNGAFSADGSLNTLAPIKNIVSAFNTSPKVDSNTSASNIQRYLSDGKYVQIRLHGPHFVAVTGVEGDKIYISDPGQNCSVLSDCYPASKVAELRVYTIG